jgi:hypothetical protein
MEIAFCLSSGLPGNKSRNIYFLSRIGLVAMVSEKFTNRNRETYE